MEGGGFQKILNLLTSHLAGCHLGDTLKGVVEGADVFVTALSRDIRNGGVGVFDQLHRLVDPETVQIILKIHTGVGNEQGKNIGGVIADGFSHIGKLDILSVMFCDKGQCLLKMDKLRYVLLGI